MLGAEVEVEQVNFVVTRHLLALVVIHQTTVQHLVRAVGGQWNGAADQPDVEIAGGFAQKILDLPAARLFAHLNFVLLGHAHERKEFRQHHQLCPLFHRFANQAAGFAQVAGYLGAGGHLDGSDFEGLGCTRKSGGHNVLSF